MYSVLVLFNLKPLDSRVYRHNSSFLFTLAWLSSSNTTSSANNIHQGISSCMFLVTSSIGLKSVFQFSLKEFRPHTISFLIIHWWMMRALTFSSGKGKHNELMKPHAYSVNTILLIFLSFLSGTHQVRKYPTQIALLVLLLGLLTWPMIQRKDGAQ